MVSERAGNRAVGLRFRCEGRPRLFWRLGLLLACGQDPIFDRRPWLYVFQNQNLSGLANLPEA